MLDSTQEYRYQDYVAGSALTDGSLLMATSGGVALRRPSPHPHFFTGFLVHPGIAAEAMRAVGAVAATRYATLAPPASTSMDPVVTSAGDRLRFEAFSACGGVHIRFDLLDDGFDGDVADRGTTNVDIGESLRRFLARVAPRDTLRLSVGADELVVAAPGHLLVEHRVALPKRWLRGFAEAQIIAATLEPRLDLTGAAATAFLTALPSAASGWVVRTGRGCRLSSRGTPDAAFVAGADRLAALVPLLRHATTVRVYGPAADPSTTSATSAWELTLPGGRLTVTLSADRWRGFSGEGATVDGLAAAETGEDAAEVHARLAFEPTIAPAALAERTGLPLDRVRAALTRLGFAGLVGYDLAEASHFHRELPYDPVAVQGLVPQRIADARALLAAGAVRAGAAATEVTSGDAVYRVRLRPDGSWSCTCLWWTTHEGARGPCKHVLAARLLGEGAGA